MNISENQQRCNIMLNGVTCSAIRNTCHSLAFIHSSALMLWSYSRNHPCQISSPFGSFAWHDGKMEHKNQLYILSLEAYKY